MKHPVHLSRIKKCRLIACLDRVCHVSSSTCWHLHSTHFTILVPFTHYSWFSLKVYLFSTFFFFFLFSFLRSLPALPTKYIKWREQTCWHHFLNFHSKHVLDCNRCCGWAQQAIWFTSVKFLSLWKVVDGIRRTVPLFSLTIVEEANTMIRY